MKMVIYQDKGDWWIHWRDVYIQFPTYDAACQFALDAAFRYEGCE